MLRKVVTPTSLIFSSIMVLTQVFAIRRATLHCITLCKLAANVHQDQ